MAVKKSKAVAAPEPKTAPVPEAKATMTKTVKPAPPKAKAAADTAAKAGTPKPSAKKPEAPKAAPKKPAPVKLTDGQTKFLHEIHAAAEPGYKGDKKAVAKSLESLLGKKLIKKGAKDKASGAYHYTVSKAGQKHIAGAPAS